MRETTQDAEGAARQVERLRARVEELERRLSEAEGFPAQLFDLSSVGIVRAGLDGRFLEANDRFCEMVGYPREALLGSRWHDLTPEEDLPFELEKYRVFVANPGDGTTFRKRYVRRDGTRIEVELSLRLFRNDAGEPESLLGFVQDLSDRLRAEAASRESERLLRHIIDLVPHFIFAKDEESRFLLANRALADTYGTTVEELVGRTDADFSATPEEAAHFHEDDLAVIRSGSPKIVPEEAITDNAGNVHWLQTIKIPFRYGPDGTPAILGVATDVTDRKLALDALRQSEGRYRLIAEHVADVIWTCDLDLRFTYMSPSITKLRGVGQDEALRQRFEDVMTPESFRHAMDILREELEREAAGGADPRRSRTVDLEEYHAHGGTIWTSNEVAFLRDESGRPIGLVGVTRDVTERRRAEEALRESERRFREMLETVRLAAVMLDTSGRVTFANEGLASLTGWPEAEISGRDWFELAVSPEHHAWARAEFADAMRAGSIETHFERPIVTRRGETRQVVWDATVLRDPGGAVIGTASLGRDVTEVRKLEEQLRHAQKMEAIGQLAGGVAHDFNNVLQVITGYLDLAMARLEPGRSPRNELEQVSQAAERATALVRQLLTFSRRETVRLEDLDLDGVIAGTLAMVRRVIGEHITLDSVSNGPLPPVHADPRLIEHVLLNLCVNARDAMPDGGHIRIATRTARFDAAFVAENPWAREGRFVELSVGDQGCGIPPEALEHVFEPFFTTKEVGKGTGLGLATVYGIVRQHDGLIRIESEVGHGTEFRIYFPEAPPSSPRAEPRREASPPTPRERPGRATILLAEDEDVVRDLAKEILERAGYRVLPARDGVEALEIFERSRTEIDLVVLDAVMPRRSGAAAFAAMRDLDPSTRAIFCSGYGYGSLEDGAADGPTTGFLRKPFAPSELLSRVREILDRPR